MTVVPLPRAVRSGLAFRALPDSGLARCEMGPDGVPRLRLPGHMELAALGDPAVARMYPEVWHAPGAPLAMPPGVGAVLNLCASAEHCGMGLGDLDAVLPAGVPVFNHPRAVLRTRRDRAATVFAPVRGLSVPLALRFLADRPGAFAAAFAAGGFRYPVTVQPAGDTTDIGLRHVAHPGDWQGVLRGAWGGRHHVMVQSAARRSPWRLLLGMAGKAGHAEVFSVAAPGLPGPPPPPPETIKGFAPALMRAARGCLPLDCWSLVVALEPHGPVFDRVMVGLPSTADRLDPTAGDVALRRVQQALARPLAGLVANPALWRLDAATLPSGGTA